MVGVLSLQCGAKEFPHKRLFCSIYFMLFKGDICIPRVYEIFLRNEVLN